MACMEHSCVECGHTVFNNDRGPSICPKCLGDMVHLWDEANDYNREREDADKARDEDDMEEE